MDERALGMERLPLKTFRGGGLGGGGAPSLRMLKSSDTGISLHGASFQARGMLVYRELDE